MTKIESIQNIYKSFKERLQVILQKRKEVLKSYREEVERAKIKEAEEELKNL